MMRPPATPTKRLEIDHRTIKLLVGLIALFIAPLADLFANTRLDSISASYYEGGWSQTVFIGFLFAISALMMAYNGYSYLEMWMSKIAATAGICIVLFPCQCGTHTEQVKHLHGIAAALMFLILAWFCYNFLSRAKQKKQRFKEAKYRIWIYTACGIAILLAIVVLAVNNLPGEPVRKLIPRITFYGEFTGLMAFGASWLTASRVVPLITNKAERFLPGRSFNPD